MVCENDDDDPGSTGDDTRQHSTEWRMTTMFRHGARFAPLSSRGPPTQHHHGPQHEEQSELRCVSVMGQLLLFALAVITR